MQRNLILFPLCGLYLAQGNLQNFHAAAAVKVEINPNWHAQGDLFSAIIFLSLHIKKNHSSRNLLVDELL